MKWCCSCQNVLSIIGQKGYLTGIHGQDDTKDITLYTFIVYHLKKKKKTLFLNVISIRAYVLFKYHRGYVYTLNNARYALCLMSLDKSQNLGIFLIFRFSLVAQ